MLLLAYPAQESGALSLDEGTYAPVPAASIECAPLFGAALESAEPVRPGLTDAQLTAWMDHGIYSQDLEELQGELVVRTPLDFEVAAGIVGMTYLSYYLPVLREDLIPPSTQGVAKLNEPATFGLLLTGVLLGRFRAQRGRSETR